MAHLASSATDYARTADQEEVNPMSRRYLVMLFAFGPLALLTGQHLGAQHAGEVYWRMVYNDARREAEAKGLPLLLDISRDQCYWCDKLDQTTFRDERIVPILNSKFIPLKINASNQPKLAEVLRISAYPTVVFAAPDGRILKSIEGYQDAAKFYDSMQLVLASIAPPDWLSRDYELAQKLISENNYTRAIPTLQRIVEEGKGDAIAQNAKKLLDQLEQKAGERVQTARRLNDEGKAADAMRTLADTARDFPGLQATKNAGELLASLAAQNTTSPKTGRNRVAQDLLQQARENYKTQDFLLCLDRCETLVAHYGDLPEGKEAYTLATEIKNNPEWLSKACNHLGDRLAAMYLALGEAMLTRGQPEVAIHYFERVIQSFPESRRSEVARVRLQFLQRQPTRVVDFTRPNP